MLFYWIHINEAVISCHYKCASCTMYHHIFILFFVQMYGVSIAHISVGFEYSTCQTIVWSTQTAPMYGFHMAISDVGGWNLDIHHMYNFEAGECTSPLQLRVFCECTLYVQRPLPNFVVFVGYFFFRIYLSRTILFYS